MTKFDIDPSLGEISASDVPEPFLSFAPVLRFYEVGSNNTDLEVVLGIPRSRIAQYRENGISLRTAEHICNKLGIHPSYVWGPEYHIAVYMMEIVADIKRKQHLLRTRGYRKVKSDARKAAKEQITTNP